MKEYVYEGKEEKEILEKALSDLKLTENDILLKKEIIKGKLFKSDSIKLHIYLLTDVVDYLKKFLEDILSQMKLDVKIETSIREKQLNLKMFSDNNPILIGKNGQTLNALTTICKQVIFNQLGVYPYLNLDVENYKDKQIVHLERLAKNIAKEVKNTNREIIMENMNSYERRIVHNCLTNFKGVITESEGEEPNRHIIVKPKKD